MQSIHNTGEVDQFSVQSIHNTGEVDQFSVLVYLNSIVHSNKKTMDYKDANLPHMQVAGFHCLWLVLH